MKKNDIISFIFLLGFAAYFFDCIPGLGFISAIIRGCFQTIWNLAGTNPIVFIIVLVFMFASYKKFGGRK